MPLPTVLVPLVAYLETRFGTTQGIAFIDSLPLPVCHNRRIPSHKVFAGLAQRGKNSVDWFYGWKLPFVIVERGSGQNTRRQINPGGNRRLNWALHIVALVR